MKKRIFSLISIIFVLLISSACGPNVSEEEMIETAESIAGTMAAYQLTEIAKSNSMGTATPKNAGKPTETFVVPTLGNVMPTVEPTATSEICLAASLVDETNIDGTTRLPGETFTQTWILRNTGYCTWNQNYSLVWVSDGRGIKMSTTERMALPGYIAPGEVVYLTVDFTAPNAPGPWSSFFQIESPNGTRFGPPPNSTFWVNVVVPQATGLPVSKTMKGTIWSVRSDGKTEENLYVGDNDQNLIQEAYGLYSTEGIPSTAVLSNIGLTLGGTYRGNPFGNLGCLNVTNAGSGELMWRICGIDELSPIDKIWGDSTSISAGQSGIYARDLQIRLSFDTPTNNDDAPDRLLITSMTVTFVYNVP